MNTKGFGSMQKFVTICRTEWDLRTERRMNSDGDAIENQCDGGDSYYCGKPAAENPEHTWVLSEAGIKATRACIQDAANRFPDNFDMYIYNDFEGYGQFEMLENVLVELNYDLTRKSAGLFLIWSRLEEITMYVESGDMDPLIRADDPDRVRDVLKVYGMGLLVIAELLQSANLLKADSVIPNIGFIVSIWIDYAASLEDYGFDWENDELHWVYALVVFMDTNSDIVIKGVYRIEKQLSRIRDRNKSIRDSDPEADKLANDFKFTFAGKKLDYRRPDWKTMFGALSAKYRRVGGTQYDITKMSRSQKRKFEFDNGR